MTEIQRKLKEKELKRKTKMADVIYNDVDRYLSDPIEGDDGWFDLLTWSGGECLGCLNILHWAVL